jgi:hypothetical protein
MGVNNPHDFGGLIWWVDFLGRSKRYTKTVGGWFHDAWNDNSNFYLLSHGFLLNMICNWDNLTRGHRRSCWPLTNNGHYLVFPWYVHYSLIVSHMMFPPISPKKVLPTSPNYIPSICPRNANPCERRWRSPDKAAESSEPLSSSAWLWSSGRKKPTANRGTMDGKWQY